MALLLCVPVPAQAGWDLFLFVGRTFPTFDDRLTFRIPPPSIPGVDVNVIGSPSLDADGGVVFGAAVTAEAGIIGIEGRIDSAGLDLDLTGARYELTGVGPPVGGAVGTLELADGRFDVERLKLLSLNLRLRTPGPIGLVASGGLSYLPSFSVGGSVPLRVEVDSALGPISVAPPVRLVAAPEESEHRLGVNGGLGLRIGGGRLAVAGEGRVFYFRHYELRFASDENVPLLDELLASFDPIRFRPVIVTAQVGLLFLF